MEGAANETEYKAHFHVTEKLTMSKGKQHAMPEVGATFETTYKGRTFCLTVSSDPQGIIYVVNGKAFRSPTAAARSITKNEVNGWKFWNMDKPKA